MCEFERLKMRKDELLQRQREATERPLLAEIDELRQSRKSSQRLIAILTEDRDRLLRACKAAYKLPQPWIAQTQPATISWPEWDAIMAQLERAISAR